MDKIQTVLFFTSVMMMSYKIIIQATAKMSIPESNNAREIDQLSNLAKAPNIINRKVAIINPQTNFVFVVFIGNLNVSDNDIIDKIKI